MKNNETILAWHWCRRDLKTKYTGQPIAAGETLTAVGPLELCSNGLHASECPLDALKYAPGEMLCRVELSGEILRGEDKLCARRRKVLWVLDCERIVHEFACECAERALKSVGVTDSRCWAAIQAKRDWMAGKIGDVELDAAYAAARDAARAAAYAAARAAARAAAWDAARAAARDAARAAARAAAWDAARAAAWAAARAAAWDAAYAAAWDAARAAARAAAWDAARAAERKRQAHRLLELIEEARK